MRGDLAHEIRHDVGMRRTDIVVLSRILREVEQQRRIMCDAPFAIIVGTARRRCQAGVDFK